MKAIRIALIFGWFFAAQTPLGSATSPKATVTQVVGPFQTETECQSAADETEQVLKSVGMTVRLMKCVYKQEA